MCVLKSYLDIFDNYYLQKRIPLNDKNMKYNFNFIGFDYFYFRHIQSISKVLKYWFKKNVIGILVHLYTLSFSKFVFVI